MADLNLEPVQARGVRLRAIFVALLLVPFNAFWMVHIEVIRPASYPSLLSLFPNVVFVLVLLTLLNALVKLVLPETALRPGELLITYVMLCMSTALCTHDVLQGIAGVMTGSTFNATPENGWADKIQPYMSKWFVVTDEEALNHFFEGKSSLYTWVHVTAWLGPVLMWCGLLFALVFVMICINVIVR